ncbi:hypothetical protein R1flu_010914 [Riccia fluitans]|uniref:Uncharacterized protein n=1 Tax=Riccia fluitans TaxID=41844 RepID=A0ABD1Z9F6_9MARC
MSTPTRQRYVDTLQLWAFHQNPGKREEEEAAGGNVVQRSYEVQRNPLRGEKKLDKNESGCLEGHGSKRSITPHDLNLATP